MPWYRKLRSLLLAAGVSMLASWLAGGAVAEPTFSFPETPGKLPKTVVPTHYAIELAPDLQALALPGSETIDIEVREPTSRLVLNAVGITFGQVVVDDDPDTAADVTLDAASETATLSFHDALKAGAHRLHVAFNARINRFGRGLFVVDYPTDQGQRRMISSHLEPADARRIFPSFDEPAFKASFELAVTVPKAFLAVSNMPATGEEPVGDTAKRVAFAPTPRMSSYLFVLTAGDMERLDGDADGVSIGVVTTLGKRQNGRFALDSAIALLKYYNEYFGIRYPLPKLDLIALPGGSGGAMENWGGITFFESRLLFDPASSAPALQRGIFSILAHEMAHQWFGDLVTMAWWDNLWLNEGFASWMDAKSTEHFHPDWQAWLNIAGAKQSAMSDDARRTTHPIQQPVAHESEAMALFDGITYSKGQAFIRMLESFLGADTFRDGIRRYMGDHAYSNTTTADLWRALEAASGKPVATIAAAYTEQPGVPLVVGATVCRDGRQRIVMKSERFAVHDPNPMPLQWPVPVALGRPATAAPKDVILLDRAGTEIDVGPCGEPVKLNLGDVGYYRVQYDPATLARLTRSMASMAPADRVNLIADSWAMVEAGRAAPSAFFGLVAAVAGDDDRAVWDQVLRVLGRLDHLERGRPGRDAFQAWVRATVRPVFDRVGWDATPGEDGDRPLLRSRLIRALGDFGDAGILAEAKRRFAAFLASPASVPPALRDAIVHLAGRTADRATYEVLMTLSRQAASTEERMRYYYALAAARDPQLAESTLRLALTDEVPTSAVSGLISTVASSGEHADLAYGFVRTNFSVLSDRLGPSFRNYFLSNLMMTFS
ncbi:MAG TPA: M1 family metallopeptidase, partial [Xanthobacteraceae bacterium]|nr:M1 family metallopeptidase [Xanthobacteraceae bacterium]